MRRASARLIALSISSLLLSILLPISIPQATATPALVTCVNLESGAERISRTGVCRIGREARANWHKNQSDSAISSGASAKVITICSNKASSPVTYQVIRKKCARHQVSTLFSRSGSLPAKPVITEAISYGHDNASLTLAADPASGLDAPVAYYTITIRNVDTSTATQIESKRIFSWRDLGLIVGGLQGRTTYTFTVTATSVDGTSPVSIASIPVTTPAYVPPASSSSSSNSSSLAAPAFTLSSTSETKIVNNAISGYTIDASAGGTIATFSISPAAPAGLTFSASTGLLSGTPTSTQGATTYTITATNASGSATRTFTLTVSSSAPSFTLSSTTETRVVTTELAGYTIASTGTPITSYSLVGTLPAGLSFSTSNGLITGTPTESRTATTYTIIGASASGETATATYRLRVTGDIGEIGPGGGRIFYYLAAGFSCGPTGTSTCKYLEVAPNNWAGTDPAVSWAQSTPTNLQANIPANNLSLPATIGRGARNTKAIIDQGNTNSATSAAARANAYSATIDGVNYSGWVLPSEDELSALYTQRVAVGMVFTGASYWSSTSTGNENGRYMIITHVSAPAGSFAGSTKNSLFSVRPIRAF